MHGAFVIVTLLGGLGAAFFGTAIPGGLGTAVTVLGGAAFGAALVLIGMRLWEMESSREGSGDDRTP